MGHACRLLCVLVLAALGVAAPAGATSVTVEISGTWDSVVDNAGVLDGSVTVGGSFLATLVYDDGTPDSDPDPSIGAFDVPSGSSDLSLTTGNYTFSPGSALGIAVDDDNIFGEDAVFLFAESYTTTGPLPTGISTGGTSFSNPTLTDSSGNAHDSDSLVDLPWSIDAYDLTNYYFFTGVLGAGAGKFIELSGTITDLAVLPEPSMFVLVALALIALAGARLRA